MKKKLTIKNLLSFKRHLIVVRTHEDKKFLKIKQANLAALMLRICYQVMQISIQIS